MPKFFQMRMARLVLCLACFLFGVPSTVQSDLPPKLVVHFFGSPTCGECAEIKQGLLKVLAEQNSEKLEVRNHNIDEKDDFQLLEAMEKAYGAESSPQQLFLPDTVLSGYESIMEAGYQLIESYLGHPEKWIYPAIEVDTTVYVKTLQDKFQSFTFVGILAAGLVDGVNPCAIATMIFLISFLAMQKRKRTEVLIIGLSFTTAVFVTYLLVGLGLFRAITALESYAIISKIIKWFAVAFASMVSLLSFWDAFRYKTTGETKEIKLQLPKAVKLRIHRVISGNLGGGSLVVGAIVTGFFVTLLEAVCTGQVYIPTIILMTRESGLKFKGWLYLLFYNFLFVLPLLIIMILAYFGLTWNRLSKATQKHLVLLKIALGVVVGALAVFLAFSL